MWGPEAGSPRPPTGRWRPTIKNSLDEISMNVRLFAAIACCSLFVATAVHAEVKVQTIDYKDGDFALRGYLAYDDSSQAKRPGVLSSPSSWVLGTWR